MKYLIKIDRIAAWTLLASVLGYIMSGFVMTKGILDAHQTQQFSELHLKYLPLIMIVSFCIHTPFAIHLALQRWHIWNIVAKVSLTALYAAFFLSFLYMNLFYKKQSVQSKTQTSEKSQESEDDDSINNNTTTTQKSTSSTTVKYFTIGELAKYNGENGQPAYVAVDGVVYDLSTVFVGGQHKSHVAGQDLTNDFNSKHYISQITKYPVMGRLK